MLVDRGSMQIVEQLGSGTALGLAAGEDAAEVTKRAAAGDTDARAAVRGAAQVVAICIANLAYCFMPERVVIGGGVAHAGELLLEPV